MGYFLLGNKNLDISFHSNYREALFGLLHLGLVDNSGWLVLPVEDKPSIEATIDFYKQRISKRKEYPVFDGKGFSLRPVDSIEVKKQVLGLPDQFYSRIDFAKDIIPQLTFAAGASDLRKECYQSFYQPLNHKWYCDDFKLYCLTQGFFFPFDETKPFIEGKTDGLPVYINEKTLTSKNKQLYLEATSARFAIDFLYNKYNKQFIDWMKRFDVFSFDRRLDYFVNLSFDQELADLVDNEEYRIEYAALLRSYLASLINVLYDDYSFSVLNKVTTKLSYMSVSMIHGKKDTYVLSSFNGDMFSYDQKNWFFLSQDTTRIKYLVSNCLKSNSDLDALDLYCQLGLPYPGYKFISNIINPSVSKVMKAFPFEEGVSDSLSFLSAKRVDSFYSYLSKESEHDFVFQNRRLNDEGVNIDLNPSLPNGIGDSEIQITVRKASRRPALRKLFDEGNGSFVNEVFYSQSNVYDESPKIKDLFTKLDQVSGNTALPFYLRSFSKKQTVNQAIAGMLKFYNLQEEITPELTSFGLFAATYPILIEEMEYRFERIQQEDTMSLMALDGLPKTNETYEPNLPYPYVNYGALCYSFRENYFSTPYICASEKEAIFSRIEYYGALFDYNQRGKKASKTGLSQRNYYILSNLGLPDNINSLIDITKPLVPQIPFKDHLCHLCNHTTPSYHENIDDQSFKPYNVYFSYIRSLASIKGVFFVKTFGDDFSIDSFIDAIENKTYHSLLSFERSRIDPILLPYIDITKNTVVALLTSCFQDEMGYKDFTEQVSSFASLGIDTIRKMMFDCTPDLYELIQKYQQIFYRLFFVYKMIELSYAFYISRKVIPGLDSVISLNIDYNPRLPYPYVFLGRVFNAYAIDPSSDHFYFCQCDKTAIHDFLLKVYQEKEEQQIDKQIEVATILAVTGLPLRAVIKYADYDLSLGSIEDLFAKFEFRDAICRRCTNINHCAYVVPFNKAYPFKENLEAEYSFANNQLAKEGILVLTDNPLSTIKYDSSFVYDVTSNSSEKLPILLFSHEPPANLFSFMCMDKDVLKNYLFDFNKLSPDKQEIMAYANGVILDTYSLQKDVFFNMIVEIGTLLSLDKMVREKYFPQVNRVRPELIFSTEQVILGFLTYLLQKFIESFALLETRVGRK
jgi:hypothetical protein